MGTSWSQVPLGELLKRNADWITIEPEAEYRQITARLWGKGLVLRGVTTGRNIAAASQLRVREGQFLVSRIDARHGAFGLVPPVLDGAVTSNDFPTFTVDGRRLAPRFLQWISRTDWFVALCRTASEGSTNRVRLKEERFLAQTIPLPPLSEQHRIVAQLDAADERVKAQQRVRAAIDAELDTTLTSVFQHITTGARRACMGDVAPLIRREVAIDPDMAYPELGIRSHGKGTFHKPALPGIEVGSKRLFRVEQGDLVFNIVFAWEGAVALAGPSDHGRFGSHRFLTCVADQNCTTASYLRYALLTPEGILRLSEASPGGAGRNRTLGLQALARIEIPLPSLDAQRWFDAVAERASAARERMKAAEVDLAALLPALLHRAFERVPEASPIEREVIAAE